MKIPNGKKHIIWARICKTGSTSTVKTFEKLGINLYVRDVLTKKRRYDANKHILFVHEMEDLQKVGVDINDCFIFTITRNPYKRALSGWKYHPSFAGAKSFLDTLKNLPYCPPERRNTSRNNVPLYSSWLHLAKTMTEWCTCNGKFRVDHVMKLENYEKDFRNFCNMIDIAEPTLYFEKQNTEKKYSEIIISREEKNEINKLFADDFKNFNYDME